MEEVAEFAESESVTVGDFRNEQFGGDARNGPFDDAAGRVDMVHDIQGRGFLAEEVEDLHQVENVLGIVEIAGTHVLDFHDDGVEAAEPVDVEFDMVGPGGQFRLPGIENDGQIAPVGEDVVHPPSAVRIPAVLGTEAADLPVPEGLVQLVFQRCRPE